MAKNQDSINNPYFNEMKGYVDQRDSLKASVNSWKTVALLTSVVSIFAVSGMIYIGAKSKFIPMVFYTDTSGAMQFGGLASDNLRITQPMIANQLAEYVISLRQIPLDLEIKTEYLNKLKMMSNSKIYSDVIYPMVKDRYVSNVDKTIKVKIRNVIPIGKSTYQIDWDETMGQRIIGKYKSSITFSMNNNFTDPAVALYDPLGIVVNDVNINQEVE